MGSSRTKIAVVAQTAVTNRIHKNNLLLEHLSPSLMNNKHQFRTLSVENLLKYFNLAFKVKLTLSTTQFDKSKHLKEEKSPVRERNKFLSFRAALDHIFRHFATEGNLETNHVSLSPFSLETEKRLPIRHSKE